MDDQPEAAPNSPASPAPIALNYSAGHSQLWTNVAEFRTAWECEAAAAALDAAGIPVYIHTAAQHASALFMISGLANSSARLDVPEEFLDRARVVIQSTIGDEAKRARIAARLLPDIETDEEDDEVAIRCPACGQRTMTRDPISPWLAVPCAIFLNLPLLFIRRVWTCRNCGHASRR